MLQVVEILPTKDVNKIIADVQSRCPLRLSDRTPSSLLNGAAANETLVNMSRLLSFAL